MEETKDQQNQEEDEQEEAHAVDQTNQYEKEGEMITTNIMEIHEPRVDQ